ncbi:MAG: hypothetical protein M1823_000971 [Watsoniomyces obsoletus]|nr:MAG: hypothetical protein M1823_000971 [Watsoniomyces obsoletus]
MASGVIAAPPPTQGSSSSDAQSHEIAEYEKIIRLHDEILAGTHPRLKIPTSLAGKLGTSSVLKVDSTSPPRPAAGEPKLQPNTGPSLSTQHGLSKQVFGSPKATQTISKPGVTQAPEHAKPTSIPEDPVTADIRAKRERFEAMLRENLGNRQREARQRPRPSDIVPDFQVSEVLERALTIVQHLGPPAASCPSKANTSKSDSFDENSYYSSQHDDTPAPKTDDDAMDTRSDGLPAAEAVQAANTVQADHRSVEVAQELPLPEQQPSPNTALAKSGVKATPDTPQTDEPRSHYVQEPDAEPKTIIPDDKESPKAEPELVKEPEIATVIVAESNPAVPAGPTATSDPAVSAGHTEPTNPAPDFPPSQGVHVRRSPDLRRRVAQIRSERQTEEQHQGVSRPSPEVPIIRSHIRTPLAPQPARVSPLAVARRPAAGLERESHAEALTRPFSSLHSPESPPAPEALHPSKRRRVRDNEEPRHAPVRRVPESPLREIKQEPVSPGPFSVFEERPSFMVERAPRRQPPDRSRGHNEALVLHTNATFHSPPRYERLFPDTPSTAHMHHGYTQESVDRTRKHRADFQRYASFQASRRQQSPASYQIVSPTESNAFRAASHSVFERQGRSNVRYIREEMGPPRTHYIRSERSRSPVYERHSPPGRSPVLVQPASSGRRPSYTIHEDHPRFVEVPPSAHGRPSVAPSAYPVFPDSRLRDSDPYVEQVHVPVRMSDNPFSDRGYSVHRAPSPRVMVRRVVDEPLERTEFMTYRPREYATRPSGVIIPQEEYVYTRQVPERRPRSRLEEVVAPREFIERRQATPRAYVERGPPSPRVYEHPSTRQYEMEPGAEVERVYIGNTNSVVGGPSSEVGYLPAPLPPPPARRVDVFQPSAVHQEYHSRADDERRREREYEYVSVPPAPQPPLPAHHIQHHPPPTHPAERYTYIAEPPPPAGGRRYVNEIRYIENPIERGAPEMSEEGWRTASYRY